MKPKLKLNWFSVPEIMFLHKKGTAFIEASNYKICFLEAQVNMKQKYGA